MSQFHAGAFRRYDKTPDEEFYETPRFVTHIDDRAIAAVTQLYREHFPPDGAILDLIPSTPFSARAPVLCDGIASGPMNRQDARIPARSEGVM
jgi:hypothetical protein